MAVDLYELALRFKSEGFKAVSKDMDTLDKKGKGISKAFTALKASLAVGAVAGFIRKIAVESIEAQKQTAQLNAVIKSTGGIAGVTATDIDKMAGALQKTTVFGDDAVKSAANLLLTFTNIRGEVFKNTLPAITDLATAMGTDLNSAAIQVGKALNDPIRGVSALQRVGVSFSSAQKDVIKNLVETNRLADAQGVILKELNVQFGGSAKAARDTLGGALAGLGNAWDDLFEVTAESSKGIVGAINRIAEALPNARPKIDAAFSGFLQWIREVEVRMARLQSIAFSINRFFGGNAQGVGVGARGGGGGGGRDNGPGMLPGAVVMAPSKQRPAFGGGGGGGTTGKAKSLIPDFDFGANIGSDVMNRIGEIGQSDIDILAPIRERFEETPEEIALLFRDLQAKVAEGPVAEFRESMGQMISDSFAQTLGDAIYNGFAAAFNGEGIGGIIEAFGKTMLAGVGQIFTQLGQTYLMYGILMQKLSAFLPNPFTAGFAGVAIGAALIAMGSALGAVATGGGRGGSAVGGFRGISNTTSEITRLKFVDRPGSSRNLVPATPIHFTLVGANDPKVQREIETIVRKSTRRQA